MPKLALLAALPIVLFSAAALAAPSPFDLVAPVSDYKLYVGQQVDLLVDHTGEFVAAIKGGDLDRARRLFGPTRTFYERIEPLAELFSDLDAAIDSRADDHEQREKDPAFTGFHRIEYALFSRASTTEAASYSDRLIADVRELRQRIAGLTVEPRVMAGGAAALIEEVAASKISGEEDRYSGADLYDFQANVEGAEKIVDLLRPLLAREDAALTDRITANFASVNRLLARYRTSDGGFESYDKLTDSDRRALQGPITELAEDLSRVTGTLGIE